MIQNDTLDPSVDVNKMNTPALERLFIEMSNAETTLINNYGMGFGMVGNGNVNTGLGELGVTGSTSNVTSNTNGNNCSYGTMNHLGYPGNHDMSSSETGSGLQQQLNLTPSQHQHQQQQQQHHHQPHAHHIQQHQHPTHLTNPVFQNDSLLTESLTGSIHHHRLSRNSSSHYSNTSSGTSNTDNSQNSHSVHNGNGETGYPVTTDSIPNHTPLARPIAVSTPLSMSPSPVTLTTLSSSSSLPVSNSTETGLQPLVPIKSEPDMRHHLNGVNNIAKNHSSNNSGKRNGLTSLPPPPSLAISPPVSPINMEEQEKVKLERKRQRNRIAASKCRKRKLEKIHLLEKRVNELKDENEQLSTKVNELRDHVCSLKREVIQHINSGCPISSPDHQITSNGQN